MMKVAVMITTLDSLIRDFKCDGSKPLISHVK